MKGFGLFKRTLRHRPNGGSPQLQLKLLGLFEQCGSRFVWKVAICVHACLNQWCAVFAESTKSPIATIVIRGATDNLMDDIERAIDDGVNAYKALTKVHVVYTLAPVTSLH